jgi:hypothetical protein
MSKKGWIAVDRAIFSHEFFKREPLTEREAWLWLIAEASWEERRVRRGSSWIMLPRGQLAHSIEFMCRAWCWKSKSRVVRYLKRLKSERMIDVVPERDATRINICNYETYQNSQNGNRNANQTANSTTVEPTITLEPLGTLQTIAAGGEDSRVERAFQATGLPACQKAAATPVIQTWIKQVDAFPNVFRSDFVEIVLRECAERNRVSLNPPPRTIQFFAPAIEQYLGICND